MKFYVRAACLLLALSCLMAFASCKKTGDGGDETPDGEKEGRYSATEGMLVYYIYIVAYDITEEECVEHNLDMEKSLKDQMYDEAYTWYEILVVRATEALTSLLTYANAAVDDGVELDAEDLTAIENNLVDMRVGAAVEGLELDAYLAKAYNNSYITESVLQSVYELQFLSAKYSDVLEERFTASLTDKMVDEQLKKDGGADTTLTRNIGSMVFSSDGYGSVELARTAAEGVLAELAAEGPVSAVTFEKYAADNSNSKDIFYKNVARGDMLTEIDDWLYGVEGRKIGDLGVITSSYGAHILYYESDGDPMNVAEAKLALVDKMFDEWYEGKKGLYKTGLTSTLVDGIELDF